MEQVLIEYHKAKALWREIDHAPTPRETFNFISSMRQMLARFQNQIKVAKLYPMRVNEKDIRNDLRAYNELLSEYVQLLNENPIFPHKFQHAKPLWPSIEKIETIEDIKYVTHYFFNPETFADKYY